MKRLRFHCLVISLLLTPLLLAAGGQPPKKEEPPRSIQKERKIIPKYDPQIFEKIQRRLPYTCQAWTKPPGPPHSKVSDIAVDAEGNSYVIGKTVAGIWLNKYNRDGNVIGPFPITILGGVGNGIELGPDGFLYATGQKEGLPWIAKIDPNTARLKWELTPSTTLSRRTPSEGEGRDIVVDSDLNIFVIGDRRVDDYHVIHGQLVYDYGVGIWIAKFRENADGTSTDLLREIIVPPFPPHLNDDVDGAGLAIALDETEPSIYILGQYNYHIAPFRYSLNKYSLELDPLWDRLWNENVVLNAPGLSIVFDAGMLDVDMLYANMLYVGSDVGAYRSASIDRYRRNGRPVTGTFVYSERKIKRMLIDGDSIFLTGSRNSESGRYTFWAAQANKYSGRIIWEDLPVPAASKGGGNGLARIGGELYVAGSIELEPDGPERYYIRKYCPQNY